MPKTRSLHLRPTLPSSTFCSPIEDNPIPLPNVSSSNHRTLGRYLTGEIAIPQWLDVALKSLELEKALVALVAETKPRVPKMKLVALVERFAPPVRKPPAPPKPKRVAKVAKPPVKPRRKLFKVKSYDASVKYQRADRGPASGQHGHA